MPNTERPIVIIPERDNVHTMGNDHPIIVGLDIGTTKVVAIAGRKNDFGKLEILGFGQAESAGVTHGVVMNIEQCVRSIEAAIQKCLQSNPNLDIREVYVGIAGQHIKSLQQRGDRVRVKLDEEISREDIDLLIRDQYKTFIPAGDQIIDIIPQEYTVDNSPNVIDPIGMSGVKIGANFHIVTGERNAIRNIKRCVDKSNLITRDLVLQPLASAEAVMNDDDLEAGVAIVDIGGGTTDMAVFYDNLLRHTAVIPYAGVNITNDIRTGLGVLRVQAEQMKVQFGTALAEEANANAYITIPGLKGLPQREVSVRNLGFIIQARMQEILEQVLHELRKIELDKKLHGGIILTGGGARLNHVVQLTEFVTGINARLGFPNEHLAGGHVEALQNPMYATCIGLILRGYDDFESGRYRHVAKGNGLLDEEEPPTPTPPEQQQTIPSVSYEEPRPRTQRIRQILNAFRTKFMDFFEESEDREMR